MDAHKNFCQVCAKKLNSIHDIYHHVRLFGEKSIIVYFCQMNCWKSFTENTSKYM